MELKKGGPVNHLMKLEEIIFFPSFSENVFGSEKLELFRSRVTEEGYEVHCLHVCPHVPGPCPLCCAV